jgi:hypothetical protein
MTSIIIPGPESDANANLIIRSGSHLTLPLGDDTGRTVLLTNQVQYDIILLKAF